MALDLGTTLLTVAASFEAIGNAERAIGRYQQRLNNTQRTTERVDEASQRLNRAFTGVTRTSQLVLGPLSGIASRLGNIQSVLNQGTVGLAAFTAGFSALIATTVSAAGLFREIEVDLLGIQSILTATGKSTTTSVNQVMDVIERFSARSATPLQEAIKATQAALTFRGIDRGNLEEFLITAAGMSQAFGDSILSASVAIGKAIEAPSSALEAMAEKGLARFTTEQKKLMQSWADAGENAKVYEAIVSAVQKKVGDAGDATGSYAVTLNKLSIAWFKFRMRIFQGSEAAGAMEGVIEKVTKKLEEWTKAGSVADQVGIIIEKTATGIGNAMDFLGSHMDKIIIAFKVWASAKVVGLAVSSMLTFEAALVTGVRAITGLGAALRTLPRLFTQIRSVSGIARPLQVLLTLIAPLKGVVLVLAGIAGAFTAFGAANVNTGNAILDVWVSVLAFWETLKSRLVGGWDFLSKNVKILAENVSTKFNEMFPDFAETAKEDAKNFANIWLEGITRLVVGGIAAFDHLKGSFLRVFRVPELQKQTEVLREQLAVFEKLGVQRPSVELPFNLEGKEVRRGLGQVQKELLAAEEELKALTSSTRMSLFEAIFTAQANAIVPTVDTLGDDLAEAGKMLGDALRITELKDFIKEGAMNFVDDWKKNLKMLEDKFKIKIPIETEEDWDRFVDANEDKIDDTGGKIGKIIAESIGESLKGVGAKWSQLLVDDWIKGEDVKWRDFGNQIGQQIIAGLLESLVTGPLVDQVQNQINKLLKIPTEGGASSVGGGLKLVDLFSAGMGLLGMGGGSDVSKAFQGSVGSPESTFGNVLPTLNQAMGPSADIPFAARQTVNNFNITTPNPETFRQARGRVVGSMQNILINR